MSEWIRVEDQKPPEGPHCLVVLKWSDDDYEVTELDYGVDLALGGRYAKRVTHWMPMPELPKEVKG